jgi:hypothetical protein
MQSPNLIAMASGVLDPDSIVIGVTGHRNLLHEDLPNLENVVREHLSEFDKAAPTRPKLLLTGLAEGADRLVARCAMDLHWQVGAVLALPADQFEQDFSDRASLREFRALLGRCAWAQVADPACISRPDCYAKVGSFICANAQWLIALWDGDETAVIKEGGTAWVVNEFRQLHASCSPSATGAGKVIHIPTRRSAIRT